jgi:hypothetical protein
MRETSVSSETTGFPFRRLLRLAGITVEVFLPASTRGLAELIRVVSLTA